MSSSDRPSDVVPDGTDTPMTSTYVLVVAVEVAFLALLWLAQRYFSQ